MSHNIYSKVDNEKNSWTIALWGTLEKKSELYIYENGITPIKKIINKAVGMAEVRHTIQKVGARSVFGSRY